MGGDSKNTRSRYQVTKTRDGHAPGRDTYAQNGWVGSTRYLKRGILNISEKGGLDNISRLKKSGRGLKLNFVCYISKLVIVTKHN